MKSNEVTLKDLAKELGISPSTVSRALKDHPDISNKTKQLVSELASKLHYQPNSIALSLRSSRTYTIGVIIPELVHFFFSTVISGIEDIAYSAGYNVIVCQSNESYQREVSDAIALLSHRVDGLLISVSKETTDFDHLRTFQERGLPLIFFDRAIAGFPSSNVVVDDEAGAYKAVEHLIQQGCKRILHLAGPEKLSISRDRKAGYISALKQHNIAVRPELIIPCNSGSNLEESEEIVDQLLENGCQIDGIFANNDVTAIGAMKLLKRKGYRIPQDVAVVGYSNWQMAALVEPALSSVNQPGFEMGRAAAHLFIDEINGQQRSNYRKIVLKTDLVVRASSQRK